MKRLMAIACFLLAPGVVHAVEDADRILGVWATERAEAHVEIRHGENGYEGVIVWLKEPFYAEGDPGGMDGKPKRDRENPDPALREREIVGLRIADGFRYDGRDRWTQGTIYDPENGETYRSIMWLTGTGTLKVRGYVGIALFGRTTEWTRVLATQPVDLPENERRTVAE